MSEIREQIGQLIREARKEKGLTQKELANKLGVGEPTVNHYESGRQNLTVDTLAKIAEALGLKFEALFK